MSDKSDTVLRLKVISARAELLARSLEGGHLWPGQLNEGLKEIRTELDKCEPDNSYG